MCQHGIKAQQIKLHHALTDGRTHIPVDPCIAPIVQALNDAGLQTRASCCGHGNQPANITLEDGREIVMLTYDQARTISRIFPDIHGKTQTTVK